MNYRITLSNFNTIVVFFEPIFSLLDRYSMDGVIYTLNHQKVLDLKTYLELVFLRLTFETAMSSQIQHLQVPPLHQSLVSSCHPRQQQLRRFLYPFHIIIITIQLHLLLHPHLHHLCRRFLRFRIIPTYKHIMYLP